MTNASKLSQATGGYLVTPWARRLAGLLVALVLAGLAWRPIVTGVMLAILAVMLAILVVWYVLCRVVLWLDARLNPSREFYRPAERPWVRR